MMDAEKNDRLSGFYRDYVSEWGVALMNDGTAGTSLKRKYARTNFHNECVKQANSESS